MSEERTTSDAGSAAELAETARAARDALSRLPVEIRQAVSLCCEQQLTHREAAKVLNVPEKTVTDWVQRGLQKLQRILTSAGYAAGTPVALVAAMGALGVPDAPAGLVVRIRALAAGSDATPMGALASTSVSKGGLIVKIGLGVAALGVAAGAAFWAVGGRAADRPAPAAPPAAGAAANAGPVPDINPFNFPNFIDTPGGRIEHVAGTSNYGFDGGYSFEGPARQAGTGVYGAGCAIDADGNLYVPDCQANRIYAIIDGRWSVLAGTGARGFRDDCPADQAHFNIGTYTYHQICVVGTPAKGQGGVYVADHDNKRLRRIFLKGDTWWVETVAGGGKTKPAPGAKMPAKDVDFGWMGTVVGADRLNEGTVWAFSNGRGPIRITPDGMAELVPLPKEKGAGDKANALQFDTQGRMYWWAREWPFMRMDPKTSKVEMLAIDNSPDRAKIHAELKAKYGDAVYPYYWDGPADKCEFWCPFSMLAAWDGSAVYTGGGDEGKLRRIKDGMVKTLFGDGKFHVSQEVKKGQIPDFNCGTPMAIDKSGAVYTRINPQWGAGCMIRYVPGPGAE